ncbi:hypothetical protein [Vibrio owensii]|uniref:hypothetical protein n=1 Tax=Vibrio owensii TaxID=696485 RepID=UPI00221F6223|nr:hypothetical protein [Vibrio owensii]
MNNIDNVVSKILNSFQSVVVKRQGVDQIATSITVTAEGTEIATKRNWERNKINSDGHPKLVLVMESPHKDEFDSNNQFLGPAIGTTGDNIEEYIGNVINNIVDLGIEMHGQYELVLMNAVTFQCSLGFSTEYFRDLTFVGIWFDGGRDDFKNRIQKLNLKSDDIVINCCTKGSHDHFEKTFELGRFNNKMLKELFSNSDIDYLNKDGLTKLVADALVSCDTEASILKCQHPATWNLSNDSTAVEKYT